MSYVSLELVHEAEMTLRKAGATPENFWNPVAKNKELAEKIIAFVATVTKAVFSLVANIDRDMVGWTCIDPVGAEEGELFEPFLVNVLQPEESCVAGEEMVERAKRRGILTGLQHAEAMLREQDKIPADWRKYCLVFPEVWQSPDGSHHCVFYLNWFGGCWCLNCRWTNNNFHSVARLVAPHEYYL